MEDHILPFYMADPNRTLEIINNEFKLKFSKNSTMVTNMLYGFVYENLRAKSLIQENFKLRMEMKSLLDKTKI